MHRIAVISDTHGMLRDGVLRQAALCEVILHAGDIGRQEVIQKLKETAPVYVVKGNTDKPGNGLPADIPEELYIELYGFNFYMVHNKKHIKADTSVTDIIIYGHSHKYSEERTGNVLYLNPGSCGPGRFRTGITMAVITLDGQAHTYTVEKINCLNATDTDNITKLSQQYIQKDMYRLIKKVIKDMDSGRQIQEIAEKNRAPEELVEKICRIYSTHQGIDTDGILNRLDIWNL